GSATSPRDSANSASASGDPPRVKAPFPERSPPAQTRQIPDPNSCLTTMDLQRDPRRLDCPSQINKYRTARPDHVDSSTATSQLGESVRSAMEQDRSHSVRRTPMSGARGAPIPGAG